ncbi:uncharacterized protein [Canis lupus baileyi]|uniref:uncharacterized protein isoform X2 n=1 Tax=Canis lupus baileyi TaxID=143281 RepID=UPI003B9734F7
MTGASLCSAVWGGWRPTSLSVGRAECSTHSAPQTPQSTVHGAALSGNVCRDQLSLRTLNGCHRTCGNGGRPSGMDVEWPNERRGRGSIGENVRKQALPSDVQKVLWLKRTSGSAAPKEIQPRSCRHEGLTAHFSGPLRSSEHRNAPR